MVVSISKRSGVAIIECRRTPFKRPDESFVGTCFHSARMLLSLLIPSLYVSCERVSVFEGLGVEIELLGAAERVLSSSFHRLSDLKCVVINEAISSCTIVQYVCFVPTNPASDLVVAFHESASSNDELVELCTLINAHVFNIPPSSSLSKKKESTFVRERNHRRSTDFI